jgi:hypothetical protein
MEKLKRNRRELNYEQKILKYFYSTQFKVENYQKRTEEYKHWHPKIARENLKNQYEQDLLDNDGHTPPPKQGYENSQFAINSVPMKSKKPELDLEPKPLKPFSRKKPKKKYETLHDSGVEMKMFIGI